MKFKFPNPKNPQTLAQAQDSEQPQPKKKAAPKGYETEGFGCKLGCKVKLRVQGFWGFGLGYIPD